MVILNRICGGWPTDSFRGLHEEEKRLFYVKIKGMKYKALQTNVAEKLGEKPCIMDNAQYGYHPLWWYEIHGYDTKKIVEKCRETYLDPIGRMTYKVVPKHTTKVAEVKRAKMALQRIAPTFNVLREVFGS